MVDDKLLVDDISMNELLAGLPEKVNSGTVVQARILGKNADGVLVDIGLKMEGLIPKTEFADFEHQLPFREGETVPVLVRQIEGHDNYHRVSWRAAREMSAWDKLVAAFKSDQPVEATIVKKVKGGYVVDIGVDAFLPGSQLDLRPSHNVDAWLQKKVSVFITEMDRAKANVVVSRRKWLEKERARARETTLASLAENQLVTGTVTSLTNFGAFVDIGGVEGLLHVSDMSWHRTEKPSQVLQVGQTLQVKVLKYDPATHRISLGLKQLQPHPWETIPKRYPVGSTVKGHVTTLTNFGAFVELEPGLEGLLHVSELSWKERITKPQEVLKAGEEVTVKVILVDPAKEKISLSLKRTGVSPWELARTNYPAGSRVRGPVTHLTPFGAFVMLPEGIEGLVHISDMSWAKKAQHPSDVVAVGQEIEMVVMEVKAEAEKIILSMKHTQPDPIGVIRVGQIVTGRVVRAGEGGLTLELTSGVEAHIRPSELSEDAEGRVMIPAIGEEVTAKVTRCDPRERRVELSIRRQERDEERHLLKRYGGQNQQPLTLGDVLVEAEPDIPEE
jgi:small subunit ribosomal protein S1